MQLSKGDIFTQGDFCVDMNFKRRMVGIRHENILTTYELISKQGFTAENSYPCTASAKIEAMSWDQLGASDHIVDKK